MSTLPRAPYRRMLALAALAAAASTAAPSAAAQAPSRGELDALAELRSYKARRVSSYDTTGRNDDGGRARQVQPGETREIMNVSGAGIIKHMWFTLQSPEPYHLKRIVLRMYWDGETTPSVEAPIGDFFGLGLGEYFTYESALLSVASQRALNSYFAMPYASRARITVTNEGRVPIGSLYYNIDYEEHQRISPTLGRFHAQYRQAVPTAGIEWNRNMDTAVLNRQNKTGQGNYTILEATGRGHFVGVTHSLMQRRNDWWGEGDDMMYIDGETTPSIIGTGAEDYYLGAWCYGGCAGGFMRPTFAYQRYGNPLNGGDFVFGKWMVYRYHIESPVTFEKSLRVTIESGHANHRSDDYYTVAYWYQTEPHGAFPALPAVADRIPYRERP